MARNFDSRFLRMMLAEDWRIHRAFAGTFGSVFFPVIIFIFSLILALASPSLLENLELGTILLALHLSAMLYGLMVGAIGTVAESTMSRRLGQVNLLLQFSQLQPVSFRRVMTIFYVKEVIYYLGWTVLPLIGGIAVTAPFSGISALGIARLTLTVSLTFLLGMSVSFTLSSVAGHSRAAAGAAGLALLGLAATVWPLGFLTLRDVLLPLGIWYGTPLVSLGLSLLIIFLLSAAAILATRDHYASSTVVHENRLLELEGRFSFTGELRTLVAKEWLEIRRSGGLGPVVTGLIVPLMGIFIIVWVMEAGLGLAMPLNVVFYGALVGFMGMMVYSWLTNLERNEFFNVQPVSADMLIRAKHIVFFLLTSVISTAYMLVICAIRGEWFLLGPALLVMFSTMVYVGSATAWLTGLRTNTMLFGGTVVSQFSGMVMPPLLVVMVLSFQMSVAPGTAFMGIALYSLVLLGAAVFMLRAIPKKWRRASFGI